MNATEAACDKLVADLRGQVVNFSPPGRSPFRDLPDRRYRVRGVALWFEVKSLADRFTQGQLDFLRAEYDHGQVVCAGDRSHLLRLLQRPPSEWHGEGWRVVGEIAARGLRREAA